MSYKYAMSRVHDALEKCEGNHLKAQRMLMTWVEKDPSLLIGLAGPHLQALISHALGHAGLPAKTPMPKNVEVDTVISKPGKASQRHVDAIRKIAKTSKKADD